MDIIALTGLSANQSGILNPGSLEKHVSTNIFAKKHIYTYNSKQFPTEINSSGSKTNTDKTDFIYFSYKLWY